MEFTKTDISNWTKEFRLKLINSITGYKSPHLVGTQSKDGKLNLGLFSSVFHVSSDPARLGIIFRPDTVERHTLKNIRKNKFFTLNIVQPAFLKKAHFASAKWNADESEFEKLALTPSYVEDIKAPFVEESEHQIGCRIVEETTLTEYPSIIIVGEILYGKLDDDSIMEDGQLDLEKINALSVTGLNQYSVSKKLKYLEYPRVDEAPNFKQKQRPDNIAFDDETQQYTSHLLEYSSNIGSPLIQPTNLSNWHNTSINKFNHVFANKAAKIKEEYAKLKAEFDINELLYKAKMSFEPIIGETYHLYSDGSRNGYFLSIIPPKQWKKEYLGSFLLNNDKVWERIKTSKTK